LQKIDDKSVDLIITSPPFNLGNTHHTGFKKHKSYNDKMPEEEYQLWQLKVLNECFRVLKDNGSLLYQHKNRISKGIQISPYEWIYKSNFLIKQEIVWINRSQNFDKIRFYPFTERVYWLAKDSKTKLHNKINKQDVFDWKEWKPVGTKGMHTRAFPEKLVEDFLNVFPKAKLVLDPFIGSGTVAVVCKKMKKNFIGFEKNKEFVMYSNKRLKQL
jgi:modification methylase